MTASPRFRTRAATHPATSASPRRVKRPKVKLPRAWNRAAARTATQQRNLGYIAWSWMGNSQDIAQLDMATDRGGPLTAWGRDVLQQISATSRPASIFD